MIIMQAIYKVFWIVIIVLREYIIFTWFRCFFNILMTQNWEYSVCSRQAVRLQSSCILAFNKYSFHIRIQSISRGNRHLKLSLSKITFLPLLFLPSKNILFVSTCSIFPLSVRISFIVLFSLVSTGITTIPFPSAIWESFDQWNTDDDHRGGHGNWPVFKLVQHTSARIQRVPGVAAWCWCASNLKYGWCDDW